LLENVPRSAFVVAIDVAVEKADRDGLDALISQFSGDRAQVFLVEIFYHFALVRRALANSVRIAPRNECWRGVPVGIVKRRTGGAGGVQDVVKACRGHQRGA